MSLAHRTEGKSATEKSETAPEIPGAVLVTREYSHRCCHPKPTTSAPEIPAMAG
jgi:hypothetical protein